GPNSCGPSTFATISSYWDMNGYGTLIDCGEAPTQSGPGHIHDFVTSIKRPVGYSETFGTWPEDFPIIGGDNPDAGLQWVWEGDYWGNYVDSDMAVADPAWDWIKSEVDKSRPVAYCWFTDPGWPHTGHWVTISGYDEGGVGHR